MSSGNTHLKAAIGVGVGLGATIVSGVYYWLRSRALTNPPKEWKKVGTLSELYYYPFKSCGGLKLHSATCGIIGIHKGNFKDRMFMLIDDQNQLVTARTYPHMLKIQPRVNDTEMSVAAPDMDDLKIDFNELGNGDMVKARIWEQDVFVVECGKKYDEWFSKFILKAPAGIRLVYYSYPVPTRKVVRDIVKSAVFRNEDTGSLQDVSSYMIINNKSMDDLNSRLTKKITAYQFRPNFVINTNGAPFEEDKWIWIRIGKEAIFQNVAPCFRCILPNIDPVTAERSSENEPLQTLKKYRVFVGSKSPVMGRQLAMRVSGVVCVGDDVFVEA